MKPNPTRVLTLDEVERFDPQAPAGKAERRFWCPLCGEDKPRDAAHRCLCINTQNGLWNCKRCGEKGLLGEFRQRPSANNASSRRERSSKALAQAFSLPDTIQTISEEKVSENVEKAGAVSTIEPWRVIYDQAYPLTGTPGVAYLARRSVPLAVAQRSGVLFSRNWHGRPALVFPFREPGGVVVALAGRALQSGGMDKPAAGPKKQGAFFAPTGKFLPLAEEVPAILLCEAPLDALSLAAAGFPALALGGTSCPTWLFHVCAFRRVALAFDADDAGDAAAARVGAMLYHFGATCLRLRPEGMKDWNDYLQRHGAQNLSDHVALQVL